MKLFQRNLIVTTILLAIVSVTGCSSTPNSKNSGEFFDSSLITAKVKARLIDDSLTCDSKIKVITRKGVVSLSGYVNSISEKDQAALIASGVNGVKSVENSLIIRPPINSANNKIIPK